VRKEVSSGKELKSISDILKVKNYWEIFDGTPEECKTTFREYCKKYHPDVCSDKDAEEAFTIISSCYNAVLKKVGTAPVQGVDISEIVFKGIGNDKFGFAFKNYRIDKVDVGTAVSVNSKIAIVFNKQYKSQFDAYKENVKALQWQDSNMRAEFERYFPTISHTLELADNSIPELPDAKYIVLINKTSDVYNLSRIVANYKKNNTPFPERQAAWILNRLYNIVCYFNYYEKVCNCITLSNLWVSPEMHSIMLYNGFEHICKSGDKMKSCSPSVFKVMPQKVKDSKKASIASDLESIKEVGRKLFSDNLDKLPYIKDFLNSGVNFSKPDPLEEWNKYGKALDKTFGKRTFAVWENVPVD
jgi:hypothetical protein